MLILLQLVFIASSGNQEVRVAAEFVRSFRNCSCQLIMIEDNRSEKIIYLYCTQERVAYVIQSNSEEGRIRVKYHDQGEWQPDRDGYAGQWIAKENRGWSLDHIYVWHRAPIDDRQPYRRLSRIGIHGLGLWAEWRTLARDPDQLLEENADRIVVDEDHESKRRFCKLATDYGTVLFYFDKYNNSLRVSEIRIEKVPESILSRDYPRSRLKDTDSQCVSVTNIMQFEYISNNMSRIVRSTSKKLRDGQGNIHEEIIEGPSALTLKQIYFAAPGTLPPDLVAPHLKPVPQGTRALSTQPELQPIALEWRDGKVVKAIDQTALNVAEEMSKFQASERAKARQRWKWIGLASFGGLVLVLTAVWWWRASRKSMT